LARRRAGDLQPGWYRDQYGVMRWWDGHQWTAHVAPPPPPPPPASDQTGQIIAFGLIALAVIGTAIALFTNVSVVSGTGTVWVGAAVAAVASVGAFMFSRRVGVGVRITCAILAVLAIVGAVYDEHQVQQKRDEINQIFNTP
jgi:hypothetical protein